MVSRRDGDFLVRDCSSQPGNYVLTCRSKGQALHFVVNKVVIVERGVGCVRGSGPATNTRPSIPDSARAPLRTALIRDWSGQTNVVS